MAMVLAECYLKLNRSDEAKKVTWSSRDKLWYTMLCCVVSCCVVWCCVVLYGVVLCGVVLYGVVLYGVVLCVY